MPRDGSFLFNSHSRAGARRYAQRASEGIEPVSQAAPTSVLQAEANREVRQKHATRKPLEERHPLFKSVIGHRPKRENYSTEFLAPTLKIPIIGMGVRVVRKKSFVEGDASGDSHE